MKHGVSAYLSPCDLESAFEASGRVGIRAVTFTQKNLGAARPRFIGSIESIQGTGRCRREFFLTGSGNAAVILQFSATTHTREKNGSVQ